MDLTQEDIKILYRAAEAFVGAGDPITIGGDIEANLPVILGLIAADPRFRAGVLAAYRAGQEDAANANTALLDALRRLRDHWYGWPRWTEAAATVDVLIDAFTEGQHPRTPGEDVTP